MEVLGKTWDTSEEIALLEAVELYGFGNWDDTASFIGKTWSPAEVRDHFEALYVNGNIGNVTWSAVDRNAYKVTDHTSTSSNGQLSPSLTTPLPSIPDLSPAEQQHLGYMPKRDDFEREFDNEVELLISTLRINPNEEDQLDVDLKVAHIDMYNRRLKERFRKKAVVRDYGLVSLFCKSLQKDPEMRALLYPNIDPSSPSSSNFQRPSLVSSPCNGPNTNHQNECLQSTPSKSISKNKESSKADEKGAKSKKKTQTKSKKGNETFTSINTTSRSKPPSPLSPSKLTNRSVLLGQRQKEQLMEKLKIFSQFHSALDQQQLIENLRKEKEIKSKIKELFRFRRNGLKCFHEVASYEMARSSRDKEREIKKKGLIATNLMEGLDWPTTPKSKAKNESCANKAKEASPSLSCSKAKARTLPKVVSSQKSNRVSATAPNTPKGSLMEKSRMVAGKASASQSMAPDRESVSSVFSLLTSRNRDGRSPKGSVETNTLSGDEEDDTATENDEVMSDASTTRSRTDIDSLPAARLLSSTEKKICTRLQLTPSYYINLKGMIIKEKAGTKSKRQKTGLDSVDDHIRRRVNNYLSRSGMLC